MAGVGSKTLKSELLRVKSPNRSSGVVCVGRVWCCKRAWPASFDKAAKRFGVQSRETHGAGKTLQRIRVPGTFPSKTMRDRLGLAHLAGFNVDALTQRPTRKNVGPCHGRLPAPKGQGRPGPRHLLVPLPPQSGAPPMARMLWERIAQSTLAAPRHIPPQSDRKLIINGTPAVTAAAHLLRHLRSLVHDCGGC